MIHMSLSRVATVLKCGPLHSDLTFTGITTDSRQINPGMVFAALPGETFDGHNYIKQAEENGAVAVLVCREVETTLPVLLVADVLTALGKLNLMSLLATAGTLALLGMPWHRVLHQLEVMQPVPGRMKRPGEDQSQTAIVTDNAHLPDALEVAA
jgi:UDP-N-acetylmuramyl pentapeptide synthase